MAKRNVKFQYLLEVTRCIKEKSNLEAINTSLLVNPNESGPSCSTSITSPFAKQIKVAVKAEVESESSDEEPVNPYLVFNNSGSRNVIIKSETSEETVETFAEEDPNIQIRQDEPLVCSKCKDVIIERNPVNHKCSTRRIIVRKIYPQFLDTLNETKYFLPYTNLTSLHSFFELFKYVEDDIRVIPDCPKSNQLLSVIVKLCSDVDLHFIEKTRFVDVYTDIVIILARKLKFLAENAYANPDATPGFLKIHLGKHHRKLVILQVITVQVNTPYVSRDKILVACTVTGKVFFVSRDISFKTIAFKALVKKSMIMKILYHRTDIYMVYKNDYSFVICTPKQFGKTFERVLSNDAHSYFERIANYLEKFLILKSILPSYTYLHPCFGSTFARYVLQACSSLLNFQLCYNE